MPKAYLIQNGRVVANGVFAANAVPDDWSLHPPANFRRPSRTPLISQVDVSRERDRRLALGFNYDFADARGIHRIGTTKGDEEGWDEVTKIALSRNAIGSADPIGIMTDTGPAVVTPLEWLAVLEAAAAFRQPIWQASFVLQAMDPIPDDYAEDSHWPA